MIGSESLGYLELEDVTLPRRFFQDLPTIKDLHKDASKTSDEYQDRISRMLSWPDQVTQSDVGWIRRGSIALTSLRFVAKEDHPLALIVYSYMWI
jgi:hypothetical protein